VDAVELTAALERIERRLERLEDRLGDRLEGHDTRLRGVEGAAEQLRLAGALAAMVLATAIAAVFGVR
jgi:hypothetical protein